MGCFNITFESSPLFDTLKTLTGFIGILPLYNVNPLFVKFLDAIALMK